MRIYVQTPSVMVRGKMALFGAKRGENVVKFDEKKKSFNEM